MINDYYALSLFVLYRDLSSSIISFAAFVVPIADLTILPVRDWQKRWSHRTSEVSLFLVCVLVHLLSFVPVNVLVMFHFLHNFHSAFKMFMRMAFTINLSVRVIQSHVYNVYVYSYVAKCRTTCITITMVILLNSVITKGIQARRNILLCKELSFSLLLPPFIFQFFRTTTSPCLGMK